MLEANFRIPQLSRGYAYDALMAYPLGNPVTEGLTGGFKPEVIKVRSRSERAWCHCGLYFRIAAVMIAWLKIRAWN
jgi:hypothetical protein